MGLFLPHKVNKSVIKEVNKKNLLLTHLPAYFKSAFTLAEILITLSIIGIIAAVTLPTISAKINNSQLRSLLKKQISVYSQALSLTAIDGDTGCYYFVKQGDNDWSKIVSSDCSAFFNNYAKKMKIIKYCENKALEKGCIPEYENLLNISGCNASTPDSVYNINPVYVLADGSILMWKKGSPGFIIDINGRKGPNVAGKDLFSVYILKKDNVYVFGEKITDCLPYNAENINWLKDVFK